MTVCNMTIEGGARAGLIAPDQKTFDYLKGKPKSPKGENWDKALAFWKTYIQIKIASLIKKLILMQ